MPPQSVPRPDSKAPPEHRITLGYDSSKQELRFVMPQIPKELEGYAHATLHIEWKEPLEDDGMLMRTVERKGPVNLMQICRIEDFFVQTEDHLRFSKNDTVRIGPAVARLTISFQGESESWYSDRIDIAITQELWTAIQKKADPVPKSLPQTLPQKYSIPLRTRLKVGLWRTKRRIKKLLGMKRRTETQTIQTKAPDIKPQAQPEITETKEKETIMSTPLKVSGLTMNGSILSWTFPISGRTFQVATLSTDTPPQEIGKKGGITTNSFDLKTLPGIDKMDATKSHVIHVTVEGESVSEKLEIKHTPPPAPAPKPAPVPVALKVENLVVDETNLQAMWNPMPGKKFLITVIHTTGSRKIIDGALVQKNYANLAALAGGDRIIHGGNYTVFVRVEGEADAATADFVSAKPNPASPPAPAPVQKAPRKGFFEWLATWKTRNDAGMNKLAGTIATGIIILLLMALAAWAVTEFLGRYKGASVVKNSGGYSIPVTNTAHNAAAPILLGTTNSPSANKVPATALAKVGKQTVDPVRVEGMQPIIDISSLTASNISIKIEVLDKSKRGTIQPETPSVSSPASATPAGTASTKVSLTRVSFDESEWLKRTPDHEGKITPDESKRVGECDRIVLRIEPGQIHRYWNAPGWATIPTPNVPHCDYRYAIDDQEETKDSGVKAGYTFSYFNRSSETMYVTLRCTKMEEVN